MTLQAIDHVVLIVASIDQGIAIWRDKLQLTLHHRVDLNEAGISQAFFALDDGTFIELIAPSNDQSKLLNILKTRNEGFYVLAMKVADLDIAARQLQERGANIIGAGTERVFIHPHCANGLLIQLWPADRPHRWRDALGLTHHLQTHGS